MKNLKTTLLKASLIALGLLPVVSNAQWTGTSTTSTTETASRAGNASVGGNFAAGSINTTGNLSAGSINSTGNVGIGTTTPQTKIDMLDAGKNECGIFSKTTYGGASSFYLSAYTASYASVSEYANKVVLQTQDNPIALSAYGIGVNNRIQFYTGGRAFANLSMEIDNVGSASILGGNLSIGIAKTSGADATIIDRLKIGNLIVGNGSNQLDWGAAMAFMCGNNSNPGQVASRIASVNFNNMIQSNLVFSTRFNNNPEPTMTLQSGGNLILADNTSLGNDAQVLDRLFLTNRVTTNPSGNFGVGMAFMCGNNSNAAQVGSRIASVNFNSMQQSNLVFSTRFNNIAEPTMTLQSGGALILADNSSLGNDAQVLDRLFLTNRVTTNPSGNFGVSIAFMTGNNSNIADPAARIAGISSNSKQNGDLAFYTKQTVNSVATVPERMRITSAGNVGIGTTTPRALLDVKGQVVIGTLKTTALDYQLSVDGKIYCTELNVTPSGTSGGGWSDYVFKSDYKLASLTEVEKYIKENGHLEHVPSAEEVAKTGYAVGGMDATLLRKVEELTLYLLEQDKKIMAQEETNKKQEKLIKDLTLHVCK